MSQTILTFQTNDRVKQLAKKKSHKLGITLSEYLRSLLEEDLNLAPEKNPWLELADGVSSVLTPQEAEEMIKHIEESRVSRSEEEWDKIAKMVAGED
jgi:hypothetical protein